MEEARCSFYDDLQDDSTVSTLVDALDSASDYLDVVESTSDCLDDAVDCESAGSDNCKHSYQCAWVHSAQYTAYHIVIILSAFYSCKYTIQCYRHVL